MIKWIHYVFFLNVCLHNIILLLNYVACVGALVARFRRGHSLNFTHLGERKWSIIFNVPVYSLQKAVEFLFHLLLTSLVSIITISWWRYSYLAPMGTDKWSPLPSPSRSLVKNTSPRSLWPCILLCKINLWSSTFPLTLP